MQVKSLKRKGNKKERVPKKKKREPLRRPQNLSPDPMVEDAPEAENMLEAEIAPEAEIVPIVAEGPAYVFVPNNEPTVHIDLVNLNEDEGSFADPTLPQVASPEAPILPLPPIGQILPGAPEFQVTLICYKQRCSLFLRKIIYA